VGPENLTWYTSQLVEHQAGILFVFGLPHRREPQHLALLEVLICSTLLEVVGPANLT